MFDFSTIGPLTNVPPLSFTVPPAFSAAQASIAFWIDAVSFVVPSPLAPYSRTSHTFAACAATPANPIATTHTPANNRIPALQNLSDSQPRHTTRIAHGWLIHHPLSTFCHTCVYLDTSPPLSILP